MDNRKPSLKSKGKEAADISLPAEVRLTRQQTHKLWANFNALRKYCTDQLADVNGKWNKAASLVNSTFDKIWVAFTAIGKEVDTLQQRVNKLEAEMHELKSTFQEVSLTDVEAKYPDLCNMTM